MFSPTRSTSLDDRRSLLRPVALVALAAMAFVLAACGDDSDDADTSSSDRPPAENTDASDDTEEADAPEGPSDGAEGTVVVDGTEYEITRLRNCDPLDDGTVERELELQGLGEVDGERVQIDIYVQTLNGVPLNDVSWAGPEGIFGGDADAAVEIAADGSSVTGSATLLDAMTHTETVDIEFDLAIPSETIACR